MKTPMFRSLLVLLCLSIGQAMANDAELSLNATSAGDGNRKSSRSIESDPIDPIDPIDAIDAIDAFDVLVTHPKQASVIISQASKPSNHGSSKPESVPAGFEAGPKAVRGVFSAAKAFLPMAGSIGRAE